MNVFNAVRSLFQSVLGGRKMGVVALFAGQSCEAVIGDCNMNNFSYVSGDILESDADVIVIPVNVVGVMSAGLAKQFKEKYPNAFLRYKEMCNDAHLRLGKVGFTFLEGTDQQVAFLPTKSHWAECSILIDVEHGLRALNWTLNLMRNIRSIAMPKVGCGLGRLDWKDVHQLLVDIFQRPNVKLLIYGEKP